VHLHALECTAYAASDLPGPTDLDIPVIFFRAPGGINAYPDILHNFEDGRTYTDIRLAIGTQFTDRIGLNFDWSETEQINFNFTP